MIECAMRYSSTGTTRFCMHYVNGVRTMCGYGETRQVTVGEFRGIYIRTLNLSYLADTSAWNRIAEIAEIQARTWMYSGPYGYGDMDMLGRLIIIIIEIDN